MAFPPQRPKQKAASNPVQPAQQKNKKAFYKQNIGSLEDIDAMEGYAERETVMAGETAKHPIHKGYDAVVFGNDRGWKQDGDEPEGATGSSNRDNGFGLHYGAPVEYFGPDTNYRAEEINTSHYGRDYEPAPFKDLFKTEEKAERVGIRLREEYEYSDITTPGSVPEKGMETSLAYGSISYEKIPTEISDSRSFKSQQRFRRAQDETDEDAVKVSGLDTKHGKNIR